MTVAELHLTPCTVDLRVRGHAGGAKQGPDPVCAAASMLVCALMEHLERQRHELCELHVGYSSGSCDISARAEPERAPLLHEAVALTVCGFELLANSFPRSVAVLCHYGEGDGGKEE